MLLFVVIVDFVVDCNKNDDDDDVLFVKFEKVFCVDVLIVVVVVIEMVVLVNVELFKFFDGVFVGCNFFFIEGEYGMFLFVDVDNDSVFFVLRFILFVVVKVLEVVDIFVVFIEEEINLFCFDVLVILLIVFFVVFVVDIRLLSVFFFFNEEFIIGFVIFIWGMFVDFVLFFKNKNIFYVILLYLGYIKNIKWLRYRYLK